jgi:hypothetical protein
MIRVIVNGVSFYTTAAQIKRGVGDFSLVNTAVQLCYKNMGKSAGYGQTFRVYDDKMRMTAYDVQITR